MKSLKHQQNSLQVQNIVTEMISQKLNRLFHDDHSQHSKLDLTQQKCLKLALIFQKLYGSLFYEITGSNNSLKDSMKISQQIYKYLKKIDHKQD